MKIDVDLKERLKIVFLFFLQSYKVLMGCLLVVFVPQECDTHVCTISDNLYNQNTFHLVCLSFNYISIILFLICYIIELKRENWCVEYLDINKDYSDNHLKNILDNRPELKKQIMIINDRYYISTRLTMICYIINLILSSVYIFYKSLGLTTLTSYLSFVLLIVMKLNNAFLISADTKKNDRLLSSYMSEYQSFNVIDKDHVIINNTNEVSTDDTNGISADDIHIETTLRNRSPKTKQLNTFDVNMM